jgi:hypothetical protein
MAVEDDVRREIMMAEERMDLRLQASIAEVRTEIAEFRGEMRTEFQAVRTEIADLRAAVEEKLRDQTWKTVGAFGVLGALTVTLSQLG